MTDEQSNQTRPESSDDKENVDVNMGAMDNDWQSPDSEDSVSGSNRNEQKVFASFFDESLEEPPPNNLTTTGGPRHELTADASDNLMVAATATVDPFRAAENFLMSACGKPATEPIVTLLDLRRTLDKMHDRCIARNLRAAGLGGLQPDEEEVAYGLLDANARMENGLPLLSAAIVLVRDPLVQARYVSMLLSEGADVSQRDADNRTPLLYACSCIGSEKSVKYLLHNKKSSLLDRDEDGYTPIMLAAQTGQEKTLRHLLKALRKGDKPLPPGLDESEILDFTNRLGDTAKTLAMKNGHFLCANLIDEARARRMQWMNRKLMEMNRSRTMAKNAKKYLHGSFDSIDPYGNPVDANSDEEGLMLERSTNFAETLYQSKSQRYQSSPNLYDLMQHQGDERGASELSEVTVRYKSQKSSGENQNVNSFASAANFNSANAATSNSAEKQQIKRPQFGKSQSSGPSAVQRDEPPETYSVAERKVTSLSYEPGTGHMTSNYGNQKPPLMHSSSHPEPPNVPPPQRQTLTSRILGFIRRKPNKPANGFLMHKSNSEASLAEPGSSDFLDIAYANTDSNGDYTRMTTSYNDNVLGTHDQSRLPGRASAYGFNDSLQQDEASSLDRVVFSNNRPLSSGDDMPSARQGGKSMPVSGLDLTRMMDLKTALNIDKSSVVGTQSTSDALKLRKSRARMKPQILSFGQPPLAASLPPLRNSYAAELKQQQSNNNNHLRELTESLSHRSFAVQQADNVMRSVGKVPLDWDESFSATEANQGNRRPLPSSSSSTALNRPQVLNPSILNPSALLANQLYPSSSLPQSAISGTSGKRISKTVSFNEF